MNDCSLLAQCHDCAIGEACEACAFGAYVIDGRCQFAFPPDCLVNVSIALSVKTRAMGL